MKKNYEAIANYLQFLQMQYHLHICIKDFHGFISLDKELDLALQPFLSHTNAFCMYMKSNTEHYHKCLSMIRLMRDKCERCPGSYFGICHAGLGELVVPIRSGDTLLGTINAGFFKIDVKKQETLIRRACHFHPALDAERALSLCADIEKIPRSLQDELLPGIELMAASLGFIFHNLPAAEKNEQKMRRYRKSGEDEILTHAIEYIRLYSSDSISMANLSAFCHCSESYLSRIFKRRTGVNVNTYINKVRVDSAKNELVFSDATITEISTNTGFGDPNYFSRVFTKILGIPPTEYRRRFQEHADGQRHG